jgi:predicted amidohydrolase YtcJ
VRVVGGWTEFQFAERRMPTLDEINTAAPDTPVFILHLYDRALLNAAALRAVGFDRNTPNPPGGVIYKDRRGNPSGLLLAEPSALILYSTLAKGPTLPFEDQLNSSRQFQRELNRLGVTSAIDAGGGGQNYPEDYNVIEELHKRGEMTVRIAYNLFAQKPGSEFDDYKRWTGMVKPGEGNAMLRMNGAGENLVWSAADFENFLQPRPHLQSGMNKELERVARLLVENRWPFRIHATYDESIAQFLDVFEKVNKDIPFDGLRFVIDHLVVLSDDYFSIPEDDIKNLTSVLTVVGGNVVHGDSEFKDLAPPLPPPSPAWSPVRAYGGHYRAPVATAAAMAHHQCAEHRHYHHPLAANAPKDPFWGALGCSCFAF